MLIKPLHSKGIARQGQNKVRPEDRAAHDWYRFVLSFPPHLVQDYLDVRTSGTVLDPFCGTAHYGKKLGIGSVGIESNPIAHAKVDWSVEPSGLTTIPIRFRR